MTLIPGANLHKNLFDLGRVCMPLVELLLTSDLSWDDREKIASAIQNNIRIYKEHEAEQQHLNMSNSEKFQAILRGEKQP